MRALRWLWVDVHWYRMLAGFWVLLTVVDAVRGRLTLTDFVYRLCIATLCLSLARVHGRLADQRRLAVMWRETVVSNSDYWMRRLHDVRREHVRELHELRRWRDR